jgi:hypothetical protein
MLTDRARGVASLASGVLEFVLHRHATGGNGRGPSDGDDHSARGTVTIVPAADRTSFLEAQERQPELTLRRAHPVALVSWRFHNLCGRFDWDLHNICCVFLTNNGVKKNARGSFCPHHCRRP